jgi:hypothetical protein
MMHGAPASGLWSHRLAAENHRGDNGSDGRVPPQAFRSGSGFRSHSVSRAPDAREEGP